MKKIFLLAFLFFVSNPCFSAIDIKGINAWPYKPYKGEINLERTGNSFYDKDGISIVKNIYKFKYGYKLGIPYEYILKNNTDNDLLLKGVDSDYHVNKNITRKSHMCRMCWRVSKHWQVYMPINDHIDSEKNPYWVDFPKNYMIKKGDSIRILALGLKLDEIQKLTFIFNNNGQEFSIEF